ncbi:metallophosphoesterase family protein [Marimonas arenosa]|uniref:Serine/threonine protein phosphatase n=1 Tax=Marimonas arenosa TaxID=1795305 RepID=A0AAE4B659_9RHOB|nr:metallophosphoesterase family protein [Marimonas arenosa]MDQ2090979.1 serine/threonine protein phosphatase [Marimonas arenosa]
MTEPIYAIGDIHGQHDMLLDVLTLIEADGGTRARVMVLGDLVDRGPDSRAVLDTLISGRAQGRDWIVLRGNHDRMFLDFLEAGRIDHSAFRSKKIIESGEGWLHDMIGGLDTLASYDIDPTLPLPELIAGTQDAVPQAHLDFLRACPLYHVEDHLLFVHAGIDPKLPLDWQTEDHLLWIRDPFLTHVEPFDWLVVHGHSAIDAPRHYGNRINLDSGAGWGRPLTAAVIEGANAWVLTPKGRVPLAP